MAILNEWKVVLEERTIKMTTNSCQLKTDFKVYKQKGPADGSKNNRFTPANPAA
jgi:hypothetical protein